MMERKALRHEALDRGIGLPEVEDRPPHGVAHGGEAGGEIADLVPAAGIGDGMIEIAVGDRARLAAQSEQGVQQLPLQQIGGEPEDQGQGDQHHDQRVFQDADHRLAGEAHIIGDLVDDKPLDDRIVLGRVILRRVMVVGRNQPSVRARGFVLAGLDHAIDDRGGELPGGVKQGPGGRFIDEIDVDALHIFVVTEGVREQVALLLEPAFTARVLAAGGGKKYQLIQPKSPCARLRLDLDRGFDDVVFSLRPVVSIARQPAGHVGDVDPDAHLLVLAEDAVEEAGEIALRELHAHVGRGIRLEYLVGSIDEVDVLHPVLLRQRVHLVARQLVGAGGETLDVSRDQGQHLGHMVPDAGMLAAQHHLEDVEALGKAGLDVVDLIRLLLRDEAIHPP